LSSIDQYERHERHNQHARREWHEQQATSPVHRQNWLPRILSRLGLIIWLGVACTEAIAGNQKEEAMADSMRLALSHAITDSRPPKPKFADIKDRINYLNWLGEMSERLTSRLPDVQMRREFLQTIWYEGKRAGLDPQLVLGLIQVESGFHKYALSSAGARGYMQVMPFWTGIIGDGDARKLFNMQSNLRYGCAILRMYIDQEDGNLFLALGRYNGSRGQSEYPNMVLGAWKKWEYKN
jgi:soluble lytic murein transglycosylase-like protein